MTVENRFERIEATLEKLSHANADAQAANAAAGVANAATQANLDRLTTVTAAIAASVAGRNDRIEKLLIAAEVNRQEWAQLWREFKHI